MNEKNSPKRQYSGPTAPCGALHSAARQQSLCSRRETSATEPVNDVNASVVPESEDSSKYTTRTTQFFPALQTSAPSEGSSVEKPLPPESLKPSSRSLSSSGLSRYQRERTSPAYVAQGHPGPQEAKKVPVKASISPSTLMSRSGSQLSKRDRFSSGAPPKLIRSASDARRSASVLDGGRPKKSIPTGRLSSTGSPERNTTSSSPVHSPVREVLTGSCPSKRSGVKKLPLDMQGATAAKNPLPSDSTAVLEKKAPTVAQRSSFRKSIVTSPRKGSSAANHVGFPRSLSHSASPPQQRHIVGTSRAPNTDPPVPLSGRLISVLKRGEDRPKASPPLRATRKSSSPTSAASPSSSMANGRQFISRRFLSFIGATHAGEDNRRLRRKLRGRRTPPQEPGPVERAKLWKNPFQHQSLQPPGALAALRDYRATRHRAQGERASSSATNYWLYKPALGVVLIALVAFITWSQVRHHLVPPTALVAPVCNSPTCRYYARLLTYTMDASTDPCQDFYQHVCGRWIWDGRSSVAKVNWAKFLEDYMSRIANRSLGSAGNARNTTRDAARYIKTCLAPLDSDNVDEVKQVLAAGGILWPLEPNIGRADFISALFYMARRVGAPVFFDVTLTDVPGRAFVVFAKDEAYDATYAKVTEHVNTLYAKDHYQACCEAFASPGNHVRCHELFDDFIRMKHDFDAYYAARESTGVNASVTSFLSYAPRVSEDRWVAQFEIYFNATLDDVGGVSIDDLEQFQAVFQLLEHYGERMMLDLFGWLSVQVLIHYTNKGLMNSFYRHHEITNGEHLDRCFTIAYAAFGSAARVDARKDSQRPYLAYDAYDSTLIEGFRLSPQHFTPPWYASDAPGGVLVGGILLRLVAALFMDYVERSHDFNATYEANHRCLDPHGTSGGVDKDVQAVTASLNVVASMYRASPADLAVAPLPSPLFSNDGFMYAFVCWLFCGDAVRGSVMCNTPVKHNIHFSRAFACPKGSNMNPESKCTLRV
ncbi:hypothetical protein HPB51_018791 [Rhipicephalus microplus]|uniref:M13 family peptidase n=1 Tax=Rhipicephalus microplus TaxID=6941 RepID=A0A9J6DJ85_RHIMP|nr:hypothetical protein HPB51_018791 [Rhipicephalus microplus]